MNRVLVTSVSATYLTFLSDFAAFWNEVPFSLLYVASIILGVHVAF